MADIEYSIGIDPGWKNLGLAVVRKDERGEFTLIHSETVNPSSFSDICKAAEYIRNAAFSAASKDLNEVMADNRDKSPIHLIEWPHLSVVIERYVSYANVTTAEAENILLLIGALYVTMYPLECHTIQMLRAIDWKTRLVKHLFKTKGFNNPSSKLDKKFSIAAANACLDNNRGFNNDHEADAIDLACFGLYFPSPKPARETIQAKEA